MHYVKLPSEGYYEEKKSRFLAELFPIRTEEEAKELLRQVQKRYYDARHHCYAYVLGEEQGLQKQSDDGEPSKTAGFPILSVLKGAELTDCILIVTRYFGGTLLGTGGLVRAYTEAARDAVQRAVLTEKIKGYLVSFSGDYAEIQKVQSLAGKLSLVEKSVIYLERVQFQYYVKEEKLEVLREKLRELSAGRISLAEQRAEWYNL